MSEPHIHASPALRRLASMPPQEFMETKRRVAARPLVAAAINAHYGFEPPQGCEHIGVVAHRIVARLMADHISHHGVTPGLWKKA